MNNGYSLSGGWILVFITASNHREAEELSRSIINERLAACINIIDNVRSLYRWMGRVEDSRESLMIIKTRIEKMPRLIKLVKEKHSYEVPEIIAVPILAGSPEYLRWLDENTLMKPE